MTMARPSEATAMAAGASGRARDRGAPTAGAPTLDELGARLEQLHARSFAWALSCCGGVREEAEDVLQTAYCKVCDGRARFDGRSRLRTWIFAVIWRTAADRRRRRAWRLALLGRWARDASPAGSEVTSPSRRLEEIERAARVRGALSVLSARQRQVLELVFYHDHSIREAAEVLGLRLGTARVHYRRGKAALVKKLRGERDGDRPA